MGGQVHGFRKLAGGLPISQYIVNCEGDPVSMSVESLRERPHASTLLQFRAGEEIDLTGGKDSAEYVRGMRDAE